MRNFIVMITLMAALMGCQEAAERPVFHQLLGRGSAYSSRELIYQMQAPAHWQKIETAGLAVDSREPLAEFLVEEGVRLAVHNFPRMPKSSGIPPRAQVERWKRQFDRYDEESSSVEPQSFSGFTGLLFHGRGRIGTEEVAVMAWAMEPAAAYRIALDRVEGEVACQRRADVTIKVVGSPALVDKNFEEIMAAARTFEWIEEIGS